MTISTPRLDLVPITVDFVDALRDGRRSDAAASIDAKLPPESWPDRHDAGFLELRANQMRRDPATGPWLVRAVVLREPARVMIGHAGFHGPPGTNGLGKSAAVEIGYSIFPRYQRRGYAKETAHALIEWARTAHGVREFVASTTPGNEASLAIIRGLGFVHVGEQMDEEDGLELVFERALL